MRIEPRSAWTDTSSNAFGNVTPDRTITPSEVTGLVLHWPGDGGKNYAALSKAQVAEKLRGYRRHHINSNGWADIGYPFAIDMAGRVWEAAGTTYAAAHAASETYPRANHENMAALLVIGEDEEPSKEMAASVNDLYEYLQDGFPNLDSILGHGQVRGASTQCPGPHVAAALLGETSPPPSTETENLVSDVRMVSPVTGYATQQYRAGAHLGLDIGTGGRAVPVYAAFAGTVERIVRGRRHGQPATSGQVLAPGRSGNGPIIRNPDGERQLYGHVNPLSSLRVGQRVEIGDRIGTVDLSGITTGFHVHFEIWNSAGRTRNPMIDFRHFGVTVGAGLPSNLPSSGGGGGSGSGGGSGIEWPGNALRVDGHFGPVSRRAYQRLLAPSSVGGYTGRIDGQHGPMTTRAEQRWLKSRGHYTGRIDGDRGPMTRRALQSLLAARGFYGGRIDADLGPMTNRAMQQFLNDQRQYYT